MFPCNAMQPFHVFMPFPVALCRVVVCLLAELQDKCSEKVIVEQGVDRQCQSIGVFNLSL